ncbi:MAG: hypothetical protein LLF76_02765 [Planctomycetaceae bacterium]|nr:hypothetical protein [Planctomycetaceae bacterium]
MAIRQKNIKENFNLVGVYASAGAYLAAVDKAVAEGMVYYDTTDNVLKCYDGASWKAQGASNVTVGFPAAVALDPKATAPVEIELADATNGVCLTLDQNDTATAKVLVIENAGTGVSIDIQAAQAGTDIQGTDDTWKVTTAGAGSFASVDLANNKPLNLGSSNDVTVKWDGTDLLVDGAAANTAIKVGASNNQDLVIYGATATNLIKFDTDDAALLVSFDGFDLRVQDEDYIKFGDSDDIAVSWDGSKLAVTQATADSGIEFGVNGAGIDLTLFGDTENAYMKWDQSADSLLLVGAKLTVTGAVTIGTDGTGQDAIFYGDTAGDYMKWDQDGNTNGSLLFEDTTIQFAGANVTYGYQISTDAMLIKGTDHANANLILGAAGTNGMDVTFQSITDGDTVKFDAGAKTVTFADVNLVMGEEFIQFYDANVKILSSADGQLDIDADGEVEITTAQVDLNGNLDVSGTSVLAGAVTAQSTITVTTGIQTAAVARTATTLGDGTGVIANGTSVVAITCDSADKLITLPAPTPGNIVYLLPNATGYNLKSSAPATVAINGGTGAAVKSAVGANETVRCVCTSATTWICNKFAVDGTEAKLGAAA